MLYQDAAEAVMIAESPSIFLEIAEPTGSATVRTPVVIKNLSGGAVTLEIEDFFQVPGWQRLEGRNITLCLTPQEIEETVEVQGTVSWMGFVGQERPRLHVKLELAKPTPAIRKLLEEHAEHTPKDMKGLWDRWDEIHENSSNSLLDRKTYLTALAFMLSGLALQLPEPSLVKFLGWILWLMGSVGVAGKGIWVLWRQWASH